MKRMQKLLLLGIVFLIIASFTYYLREKKYNERIGMQELITKKDNANQLTYLDINMTPYILAEYKENSNAFYAVLGNNKLYIIYMNKEKAKEITDEMISDGYRLNGVSKDIPNNMKKYGLEFLENLFNYDDGHQHEEHHDYNDKDYDEYFGCIYLDTTMSKYYGLTIYNFLFDVTLILGLMFTVYSLTDILIKKINL